MLAMLVLWWPQKTRFLIQPGLPRQLVSDGSWVLDSWNWLLAFPNCLQYQVCDMLQLHCNWKSINAKQLLFLCHERVLAVLKVFVFMSWNKQENIFKRKSMCVSLLNYKRYHLLTILALIYFSLAPQVYDIEYTTFLQIPGKGGVNVSWKITVWKTFIFMNLALRLSL